MAKGQQTRPLPDVTRDEEAFWTGGRNGDLMIARCTRCFYFVHPPVDFCPACQGREVLPKRVSGRGTVFSYTINHKAWVPNLDVPYCIALVELAEQSGLRLPTNIVDCSMADVCIGMPVEVCFEKADDLYIPLFRPVP